MSSTKLENLEAIALIAIIMINKIILNVPKAIILSTGSSAWLNVLYISIIATIFAYIIVRLFKNFSGLDILDVSDYLGGKFLKIVIGIITAVLFITTSILVIRNFTEILNIIYFSVSPITFLILFFVVGCCIANRFGIKVLAKVNLIIAPVILVSVLIILFSSGKDFVPQRLLPVLGYGINETFFSGLSNIFGFSGLVYLLFLQPILKSSESFKKISIISLILSSIYLLLSVSCLLLVFPFIINTNENISIYLLTRMSKYGDIIQRANALFIFIWILSVVCYVSISTFFALHISKKLTNISNSNPINYCFGSIIFGGSLLLQNYGQYITFVESLYKYSILIFIFGISLLILIFANIKYKLKNKSNNTA